MTLTTRFDSLLLYDPSHARTTVNVWVARPTPAEETALGRLFVVSLIDSADAINQEVITVIQEEVQKQYYHNAAWTTERALEFTLEQVNQRLHHLISEGVSQWLDHAHLLIGALHHQQLVLAPAGMVHGYLLRGIRIHDIVGGDANVIQPLRIFSHIIVGRVDAEDRLLFCTPSLLDFFSLEKLRRTVVDYQPGEAVRVLEGTLMGAGPEQAFGALIFHLQPAAEPTAASARDLFDGRPGSRVAPQISMEQLIERQHQTENFLAPSIWPTIRQTIQAIDRFIRTTLMHRPPRRSVAPRIQAAAPRRPARGWLYSALRTLSQKISGLTLRLRYILNRSRQARPPAMPTIAQPPATRNGTVLERLVVWFQDLSRKQQMVMSLAVALLLILSVTIVQSADLRGTTPAADEKITTITEHLNTAEAALLYGGAATVEESMLAAETLIAQLSNRRADDKVERQALLARLQSLIDRTAKQTVIAEAEVLAQFTPDLPNFKPHQIYLLKNHLVAFDPNSHTAATVTLASPDAPTVIPATVDIGDPQTGTITGASTVIFVTDRLSFAELDAAKKTWRPYDAAFPLKQPGIQYISFFQNRIYALDRTNQEIYRFAKGTSSLGSGAAWFKESAEMTQARAAIVDGSIYILQPGGEVEQWVSGRKSEWQLATIRPALTEANRLWTDSVSKHLYLVDPTHQRIIVFDKNGQLIDQYTSPAWTNLRDVVADEANQQAYVANGTTVYRIPLKH